MLDDNTKINIKNILPILKADLKEADKLKVEQDKLISKWKAEYNGELYGNEGPKNSGKSRIVSRDIKKQSEWQHASIIDPFVSTENVIKCKPVTFEDTKSARQNELLLNTQFCRKFDRYNFMSKAVKVLDQEGTLVIQCGWDYKDKKVRKRVKSLAVDNYGKEIIVDKEVEETVVLVNKPTAKVCRNSDIWLDPTCQDNFEDAQFVIYRYETDLSTLKQDGRYINLEKIISKETSSPIYEDQPDETFFKFSDIARQKRVIHEYWGNIDINGDGTTVPIVCSWIDETVVRFSKNPYPDGKPPFLVVPFNSVPFKIHGEANAELIGDNQKVKTAIIRGLLDNMAKSTNGQIGIRRGALDDSNKRRFLNGQSFELNGSPHDIWQGSYNNFPSSVFAMLDTQNNEIESLTGVKSFSGGITGNSLGSTATGVRGALDSTSIRRMNIVRNIAENLVKPLMRKWLAYNSVFLDKEEVVRITNEKFEQIKRDDLEGRIDISIEIATVEDNAAKAEELSFLLQTVGPNEDPVIRQNLMADIMELMRMPENAKRIRSYQPQPDPLEQKLQELEIATIEADLAKKKAEIENIAADAEEKRARAKEHIADLQLKTAKAEVELARVRNITSNTELNNLRFIKEDEGFDHLEKAELEQLKQALLRENEQIKQNYGIETERIKQEFNLEKEKLGHIYNAELEKFKSKTRMLEEALKHKNNMEQMKYQKNSGDKNIGVIT